MTTTAAPVPRPHFRPARSFLAALACGIGLNGAAMAHETPGHEAPGHHGEAPRSFPHVSLELDVNLYTLATPRASARSREGVSGFLFGHFNPGFHLTPDFSVQAIIHPDPAGGFEPNGAVTYLRRQDVILEQFFAEWRPTEGLQLYAGKFNAPFGYGYEYFPGVLASFRAHEAYLIREQLGFGANWTLPTPAAWGEYRVSAAVFTQDTSLLSNSLINRHRCCDPGIHRYVRTTLREGGAGNTGNLDNAALSLEGGEIPALPGLTWTLGLLSRAPGKDGTRREWAWAAGLRYEHAWTEELRTAVFGEFVEYRNYGGAPVEEAEDGTLRPLAERRRFSTLGTQTRHGPWRATLIWQRDEAKRSFNTLPTESWLEASAGRDLGWGFGLDIGYQYAHFAREDRTRGEAHSIITRLNYRFSH